MNLRKAIRTVKLTRYAAWESGGSIVKGGFVGGEVYRYDAGGYVLCREDIDVNGTVVECPDRKVLYDSAGRVLEEQFVRNGGIYRKIVYRGNVCILDESMLSEGISVLTVRRSDLYPGFLAKYASNEKDQTLEFVEVNNSLSPKSIHFFSEYENAEDHIREYLFSENGYLLRVSHIFGNGQRKIVAMYDEDGNETCHSTLYDKESARHVVCRKRYLLESTKLRQLDGKSDKWSSALLEYFNGRTSRLEMLEIVRQ